MIASSAPTARLDQLKRDGYCIIENMADERLLPTKTRRCVDKALTTLDAERQANAKAPGSLINSYAYPELADLIGNPRALQALEHMGLENVKFWKAVIISKPPGGPQLYWHQDCLMWQDPRAYSAVPPMIFLMYYLEDTTPENGCLRLLPGSHRHRHELHDMGEAHTKVINRMENPDDPRFGETAGEIDVPVRAGDLVVGDARMFHASHANRSAQKRTVITIWFHPAFSDLQEPTQSWIHHEMHDKHASWPAEARAKIAAVTPDYHGTATPMKLERTPDQRLPWPPD